MAKAKILRPTKKADKECFDLLHHAWRAGVIDDFRFHNDDSVIRAGELRLVGWTIDDMLVPDAATAVELVSERLQVRGIDVQWGASWCGYREIIVTEREAAAA